MSSLTSFKSTIINLGTPPANFNVCEDAYITNLLNNEEHLDEESDNDMDDEETPTNLIPQIASDKRPASPTTSENVSTMVAPPGYKYVIVVEDDIDEYVDEEYVEQVEENQKEDRFAHQVGGYRLENMVSADETEGEDEEIVVVEGLRENDIENEPPSPKRARANETPKNNGFVAIDVIEQIAVENVVEEIAVEDVVAEDF